MQLTPAQLDFVVLAIFLGFIFYIYRTTVFSIRILQLSIEQEQANGTPMQTIPPNNNVNYPQSIVYPPGTQPAQYPPQYPPQPAQYPPGVQPAQYPPQPAQYPPGVQQYTPQYPEQNSAPMYNNYPPGGYSNPQNPQQPAMDPKAQYPPTFSNPPPYNPGAASPNKDGVTYGVDQPVVVSSVAAVPAGKLPEFRCIYSFQLVQGGYYGQAVPGTPPTAAAVVAPQVPIIPDAAEKLKLMMTFHKLMLVYIIATLVCECVWSCFDARNQSTYLHTC